MSTAPPAARLFRHWRLTVDKYLRMIEAGILSEDDRVFLWKGLLLEKARRERPHVVATLRLRQALDLLVSGHPYYIEEKAAVALVSREDTLPEPDLKIVQGRPEDYADYPTTRQIPLIIEIADDSTQAFDMGEKQSLYAVESVSEYWVVGVNQRWIEVFTRPSGPQKPTGYQSRRTYRAGESIPVTLDGTLVGQVSVDEVFA